ncbi:MAG TPA: 4-hydroxybenzoate 3-monooxygenase [Hyphomicrobiaceae bacterium]|nr:4-hydroxybenzoate 3-monooxygenase [Hyphomicrobiaceae bacterium]
MARRTEVGIVGAGPAGLMLAHLLAREGISSVIVEARSRSYVEGRIRAGVLEHWVADLLAETGVGVRMQREGLLHHGIELRFAGRAHRLDLSELTSGRAITVYGQHEVVKDLIAARLAAGQEIVFEAADVQVHGIGGDAPSLTYAWDGRTEQIDCDLIAGCDGFHGVCRASIPAEKLAIFERVYPFAWLGILAQSRPVSEELIYASHDDGFALFSMRAPTVTRLYLQCRPDEDLAAWSDERIWGELERRLGGASGALERGPVLQRGVTGMRSFVVEPMQYGRLYLAGDAAHIVPPTGAKGMNLAMADVRVLSAAMRDFLKSGSRRLLDAYSARCLKRIWRAERFSWWMTSLLHRFPDEDAFGYRMRMAELDYITSSKAAATALAENYVGLAFEAPEG